MEIDKRKVLISGISLVICFAIGIIIGRNTASRDSSNEEFISKLHEDRFENKDFVQNVLEKVDENNIRKFLKELSRKPHLAASKRDR